ncbi:dipicolinate synthase subunit DpsA [Massiliimalia massiliensis]|uniref:dipicolinate synthase subunit DpsA n=1 Tax=Massiliimalia massiliensis TaxID=1852384 RepID=UPI000984DB30|nr:dipicolinate synthase subunit DpsA [Massiliimalia massiliensis]
MKYQKTKQTCILAGGDLRQVHLANCLSKDMEVGVTAMGDDVSSFSPRIHTDLSKVVQPDILILPMPAVNGDFLNAPLCKEPVHIQTVLSLISPQTVVFGGKISPGLIQKLESLDIKYFDYLKREELAILNAVATAEGTLELIFAELPVTIFGLNILIVGSGRISRALRTRLAALGARVSVSARKHADLAWIQAEGCTPLPIKDLEQNIGQFDVVINTVPAKLFDESILKKLRKDALLIDLASKPGGVDFEEANKLGIKTIWALSLPGKTAPITSGEIIYQTICNIIEEEQHGKA